MKYPVNFLILIDLYLLISVHHFTNIRNFILKKP